MYILNKIVGATLSPLGLPAFALVCAGAWCLWRKRARVFVVATCLCGVWLWVWGTGAWTRVVGVPLERGWTQVRAEDLPQTDAIVLLGGGMSANPAAYPYPDMHAAADRVWHAARLYKAGKAPVIVPTGEGDRESTVPLLRDFGVPETAIVGEYSARNTEENAKFVENLLLAGRKDATKRPRILLVTSAWHMRRSLLMYERYAKGLEIIPAPGDFENTVTSDRPLELRDFFPSADGLSQNSYMFKEIVGYWAYRLLRR